MKRNEFFGVRGALLLLPLGLWAACSGSSTPPAASRIFATGETGTIAAHQDHDAIARGETALETAIASGRALFTANFNSLDGAGRPGTTGTGSPREKESLPRNKNRISGPDASSCAGCHAQPVAGGGGDNAANVFALGQRFPFVNFDGGRGDGFEKHTLDGVANERGTLGMFGSGFIELLAREISADLQAQRSAAIEAARATSTPVTASLASKGLSFGALTADPDGSVDARAVRGIDADLVVKPFDQKGVVASLRTLTNDALNHHLGMQSVERFGQDIDPDGDGVQNEVTAGDVTALVLFQATLTAPGRVLPEGAAALAAVNRGEQLFANLGCAACHVPELRLQSPIFTEPGPFNGTGDLRPEQAGAVVVDLTAAGPGPRLQREPDGSVLVRAYTDFKRHDMGALLDNEKVVQAGVPARHFLTKKLWGFASEPPYLHHGRATTIREAITMHGGEAEVAKAGFTSLAPDDADAVVAFLKTLQVPPERATANVSTGGAWTRIGDEPAVAEHLAQDSIEAGSVGVAELLPHGKRLFQAGFTTLDGAGRPATTGGVTPRSPRTFPQNFNRISGPTANSCSGCHAQPRAGGAGDLVANVFVLGEELPFVNFDGSAGENLTTWTLDTVGNERHTTSVFGSGYVELLAREMTADLQGQRDALSARAKVEGETLIAPLASKGVKFGVFAARPDGTFELSGLDGVDADLVIKPFGRKGAVASLRVLTNNELNHHHGMQTRERFGALVDDDQDGKADELGEGDVTALVAYQALLATPGRLLPSDQRKRASAVRGEELFVTTGCATCHAPALELADATFREPGPFNPPRNLRPSDVGKLVTFDLTVDGEAPRLARSDAGTVKVPLFSDLKRHDLGPENDNEKRSQAGIGANFFLTARLWGVANQGPWMHHGRADTLTEAIELHGGEAAPVRETWRKLPADQRASILDFLKTLQVLPEGAPELEIVR